MGTNTTKNDIDAAIADVRRFLPCEDEAMVRRLVAATQTLADLGHERGIPALLDALEVTTDFGANADIVEFINGAEFPLDVLESEMDTRRGRSDFEWDLLLDWDFDEE